MENIRGRAIWLGSLIAVLFLPVMFYTFGLGRQHTNLWALFLSLTGTQSLGMLAYTLALGTRFRSGSSEFGVLYHKWCALLLLVIVLIHINLALLSNPDNVLLLTLWYATAKGAAGMGSFVCLVFLIALGIWRPRFGLSVNGWRLLHNGIAWTAGLLAFCHILWIDQLVNDPLWLVLFVCILLVTGGMWVIKNRKRG